MWVRSAVAASASALPLVVPAVSLIADDRGSHRRPSRPRLQCAELTSSQDSHMAEVSRRMLVPAIHWAELHGLVYAAKNRTEDTSLATQCPVALLPFKIPRATFEACTAIGPLWGKLVDAVARDPEWLYSTLEPAAKVDGFTCELLRIAKEVHAEGPLRQKMMLGIHRSDYMLHEPENSTGPPQLLQVELNTISSSMLTHASNTEQLHRYLLGRYGSVGDEVATAIKQHYGCSDAEELLQGLPANPSLVGVPASIAKAHEVYGVPSAVVVMVVQEIERNFADQRGLEFALWEKFKVPMVRKTLRELHEEAVMDASTGRLLLSKGQGPEVSTVYFRAGYGPEEYESPEACEARLLLERSLAIKCPSIDYQLVGCKKVQQALARPGVLERYLTPEECERLRSCFAGLWGLGVGEDDAEIVKEAIKSPDGYVLKPQREGGGHNFYGADVAAQLQKLSIEERGAYILMQRIMPRTQWTIMTREGKCQSMPGLSEFGFYAVYLGDGNTVHLASDAGHLVRTKAEGVDEGGVAAGYAVINSPFLVN
mmetsp:Transcript_62445/g.115970  ORF Transcript_62445/g.115970 Transcript_62445/m.115970 type:complete len:540 (-) Transcript_62445:77-1696(-)